MRRAPCVPDVVTWNKRETEPGFRHIYKTSVRLERKCDDEQCCKRTFVKNHFSSLDRD